MLFSAGTGSGLMFFGVAEPVLHYANPPTGQANTAVAAKEGMRITLPSSIGARRGDVYAALGAGAGLFDFCRDVSLGSKSTW